MITGEIGKALDAELYYLAVVAALTMPDICAALESPDGRTKKTTYTAWYDTWMAPLYPEITSQDMYSLRCGILHQGMFGHPGMQYSRVLFTIPNAQRNTFHRNIIDGALNLDAPQFCKDVVKCAHEWYTAMKNDTNVRANLPRLVQFRANGLAPYMMGMPLIA